MTEDVLTAFELAGMMRKKNDEIDQAVDQLKQVAEDWVEADRQLKMARSKAFARGVAGRNADERGAAVYGLTEEQDYEETRLRTMKEVAKESLRAREAQLSGMQTLGSALKEELRMARVGNF